MSSGFFRRAKQALRRRIVRLVSPSPIDDYIEYTLIHPVQGGASAPNDFLINLALDAAKEAQRIDLADLSRRVPPTARDFTQTWPGEHYRLLAALVKLMQPKVVIEIGTFQGVSALALRKFLPDDSRITTFDIVRWSDVPATWFKPDDFEDGRLQQELADLADRNVFDRHRPLIEDADLLFVDGPKDGFFEARFLKNLETVEFRKRPLVVFDDIGVWNMLAVWHEIRQPKLDATSFGHWSGTGFVDWSPRS